MHLYLAWEILIWPNYDCLMIVRERGYPGRLISQHVDKVNHLRVAEDRRRPKRIKGPERVPFISTYSELIPLIG